MILNEIGINHPFRNFSHFSHIEWLVFGVSSGLLYVVWWLFGLGFDIKIKVESDWQVSEGCSISDFVNLSSVVYLCGLFMWSTYVVYLCGLFMYDRGTFCL